MADVAADADAGGERVARDDRELVLAQAEMGIRERSVSGVDVREPARLDAPALHDGEAVRHEALARRVGDRLGVVKQRDRVERRAHQQDLAAGLDEACEGRAGAVAVVVRMRVDEPHGARADGNHARVRVCAALGARPRPDPLGDGPVLAGGLARRGVEHRRLGEIGVAVLLGPFRGPEDVLLPRRVGRDGALRPRRVEQRENDGLAAADHPAERAHPRVHHRDVAASHTELSQVVGELRARHGRHAPSVRERQGEAAHRAAEADGRLRLVDMNEPVRLD